VALIGLAVAVLAEITTLVLIWPGLSPVLPIARISGFLWLIVAGALLGVSAADRLSPRPSA
jgi:hypothetical protein